METITEDLSTDKYYFQISEVADLLQVSITSIRFWESEFDMVKPKKNKKGDRIFTKKDIEYLRLIQHLLKEKGYTIEGAKKKLHQNPDDHLDKFTLITKLKEVKSFLLSLKDELDREHS